MVPAKDLKKEREPSLDDVEVTMNDSTLDKLSPAFRKLEIILRKCHKIRRHDLLPLKELAMILRETEKEIPSLGVDTKGEVLCTATQGPDNFYLQFKINDKRLYLLGNWLQDMTTRHKLNLVKQIEGGGDSEQLISSIVSVPYPDQGK